MALLTQCHSLGRFWSPSVTARRRPAHALSLHRVAVVHQCHSSAGPAVAARPAPFTPRSVGAALAAVTTWMSPLSPRGAAVPVPVPLHSGPVPFPPSAAPGPVPLHHVTQPGPAPSGGCFTPPLPPPHRSGYYRSPRPGRSETNREEPNRAGMSRAEPSRAGPNLAVMSRAGPGRAEPRTALQRPRPGTALRGRTRRGDPRARRVPIGCRLAARSQSRRLPLNPSEPGSAPSPPSHPQPQPQPGLHPCPISPPFPSPSPYSSHPHPRSVPVSSSVPIPSQSLSPFPPPSHPIPIFIPSPSPSLFQFLSL